MEIILIHMVVPLRPSAVDGLVLMHAFKVSNHDEKVLIRSN
jgi:hypothetical protein